MTSPRLILGPDAPHSAWLGERRHGITATDIAKIAGVHKYGGPVEVYFDKIGEPLQDDVASEAAELGLELEPIIARRWARQSGHRLVRSGFYAHGEHDWMRATPDRFKLKGNRPFTSWDAVEGIVELKSALGWAALDYDDDTAPDAHLFQVQWQLKVCELPRAWLVALAGPQLRGYEIERDDVLIDDLMTIGEQFLVQNVQKRQVPAPDGSSRLASLLNKRWAPDPDRTVVLDPAEFVPLKTARDQAAVDEKQAKERKTAAENALKLLLGEAEAAVIDGDPVVTWKSSERSAYTVAATTTRTLRFPKAKAVS
jgi:putative phage-type endonuclease